MSKTATIIACSRANVQQAIGTNFGIQKYVGTKITLDGWAGPRSLLEENRDFLQPIPYVVIKSRATGVPRYVTYTRGQEANEERLRDKISIGIGGHVDARYAEYRADNSINLMESVRAAALREMEEEIGVRGPLVAPRLMGIIQSDFTAVGMVHLGFLYLWDASDYCANGGQFTLEQGIDNMQFLTREQLLSPGYVLEEWSWLALDIV